MFPENLREEKFYSSTSHAYHHNSSWPFKQAQKYPWFYIVTFNWRKFSIISYKPILSVSLLVLNNVDAVGRPKAKEEMGMPTGTVNVFILHSERKKGQ